MKKKYIKLVHILSVILAVLIILTLIICYRNTNIIINNYASKLGVSYAKHNADEIDSWVKAQLAVLGSIAVQIENINAPDDQEIQNILINASKRAPLFYSFFVGFENGSYVDSEGWIPPPEYDVLQTPWYTKANEYNQAFCTSAYIDDKRNILVTSIGLPLHINNTKAVLAANISLDVISKEISSIQFGKDGYRIVADLDDIILASSNKKYINEPVEKIFPNSRLLSKDRIVFENGILEVLKLKDTNMQVVSFPIESNDWKLIIAAPLTEFQESGKEILTYMLVLLGICLIVIIFISYSLGRATTKPIAKIINDNEIEYLSCEVDQNKYIKSTELKEPEESACNCSEGLADNEKSEIQKEKHIAGTEEIYAVAEQINCIADRLEKGIRSFQI